MPYRSKETLEHWLEEFRTTREGGALINVLVQDGGDGADTGLVVVPLRNEGTEIYMQPVAVGDANWTVTLGPRTSPRELSSLELQGLVAELAVAASLCQFLQDKSATIVETD
ncbi:hypothetical protein NVV95_13825 [Herbiconiux sp. CPCC 205716]|uniref:Uncharacterized protein n=1 Tax=Herbiconiux gentiana TaxID=2970912 RepID=A0ABT2GHP6_9MICO|nr:hypothetical protein [Herbiconiux gentiana]MCS5715626.1 hypothetical protein [Herbiconiux gentiana]